MYLIIYVIFYLHIVYIFIAIKQKKMPIRGQREVQGEAVITEYPHIIKQFKIQKVTIVITNMHINRQ